MRKLPTGELCAGEPHAQFGGRGGRESFPTPIIVQIIDLRVDSIGELPLAVPRLFDAAADRQYDGCFLNPAKVFFAQLNGGNA